jgi:hypothetical protein
MVISRRNELTVTHCHLNNSAMAPQLPATNTLDLHSATMPPGPPTSIILSLMQIAGWAYFRTSNIRLTSLVASWFTWVWHDLEENRLYCMLNHTLLHQTPRIEPTTKELHLQIDH